MLVDGSQTRTEQSQDSSVDGGGTRTGTQPRTYTEEEHEKILHDTLVEQGRSARQLLDREAAITKTREEAQKLLDEFNKRAESREREELENATPEERNLIEERQRIRRREAEANQKVLAAEQRALAVEAKAAKADKLERERTIDSLIAKYSINADTLKLLIDDDMKEDRIERIAAALPKKQTDTPRGDGGGTAGGTHQSITDVRKDYISGKINLQKYAEKCKALGVEP